MVQKPSFYRVGQREENRTEGHTATLEHWLVRLESGCPEARATILQHTCERLQNMAKRMLRNSPKVRRWETTDDLLQEALLRLHRSLVEINPTTAKEFYGLAATQLRRQLVDLARKHYGKQGIGKNHFTDGEGSVQKNAGHSPESLEDWTQLHERIEQLPLEEKEVFELFWYEGLTQADAAKILGISLATFKRRWQAARLRLNEWLREKE